MYQGQLTPSEERHLKKSAEIIANWIRWHRENPAAMDAAKTYIAADAMNALRNFAKIC